MKPVCNSEEAYLFSKYILKQWLESTVVRESVGDDMAGRILYFLDRHVFPHESYYVYYRRRVVAHFHDYSNIPAKGVFRGLSKASNGPRPNHSLATAATKIIDLTNKKEGWKQEEALSRLHKLEVTSNLNVKNDLTRVGGALLEKEVIGSHRYASRRVSKDK